ncbi:hypothetical protein [Methanocaldococcus infernus]|uniref:Uncharacterized protein n=1 Tax=Methanocaldococcus infernus (strain DSM 11812 / JCM 15783 / ME) TaxID=573063 RepID=D5VTP6_METIM|nr:hypothetical protein [Methanocaldococcus infernus]ADG13949.1 conserved hypothetical protein [Methanocaldococcus infernus ME]
MKLYVYFFSISCLIGTIYCILVTLYQVNVFPLIFIGLAMAILSFFSLNRRYAKLLEKLEIYFMLIVLILFAYALYILRVS